MHFRVSNPPPKPLMIWDGECHFCKRWIERWQEITAGKVDYVTYQQAAHRFPEIPIEQFQRAVALELFDRNFGEPMRCLLVRDVIDLTRGDFLPALDPSFAKMTFAVPDHEGFRRRIGNAEVH